MTADHISRVKRETTRLRHTTRRLIGSRELPPDLLKSASKRLGILGLSMAAITLLLFLLMVVVPAVGGPAFGDPPESMYWISLCLFAFFTTAFLIGRSDRISPQRKLDTGLLLEIVVAFCIAMSIRLDPGSSHYVPKWGLSENCVLILIFPVIVPNKPWKVLLASLLAASADPLSVYLAELRGIEMPPPAEIVDAFYWNYICAGLAIIPSRILDSLEKQVSEVREMGSYRLIECIGRGGMGEVWRADHRLLQRDAAVKIIQPEILKEGTGDVEQVICRFEREAQATAVLQSPHTIDLYDFGTTESGTFYYVMELLDGLSLERLVRRFGPLPSDRVVYLLRQACHSLAEAHESGLIHRDIKPANLFSCRKGLDHDFVKVLDFGLVKGNVDSLSPDMLKTDEQTVRGTPAYMPPESVRGGGMIDGRTDLYALGCVGFWLLTGRLVFEGETAMDVMIQHARSAPEAPSSFAELPVDPGLENAILRCLSKDPNERPSSAKDMIGLLDACRFENPWTEERAGEWWRKHLPPGKRAGTGEAGEES